MLEVRDESSDLLASVHASLIGTQQVAIPSRTRTADGEPGQRKQPHPLRSG